MKKQGVILAVLGAVLVVGYIFYSLTAIAQVSCEVCTTWKGRTDCRSGAGATEEEAKRTATDVSCTLLSTTMADGINCTNNPSTSVTCTAR